jgi:hypothetical protein
LKSDDEVVGITHDDDVSPVLSAPGSDPVIEHVVEIDVCQQWRDTPALWRSTLRDVDLFVLQHSSV